MTYFYGVVKENYCDSFFILLAKLLTCFYCPGPEGSFEKWLCSSGQSGGGTTWPTNQCCAGQVGEYKYKYKYKYKYNLFRYF